MNRHPTIFSIEFTSLIPYNDEHTNIRLPFFNDELYIFLLLSITINRRHNEVIQTFNACL